MLNEVTVDGRRFVPAEECGEIKIVVLKRGFVYVGRHSEADGVTMIRGARSIIRWGTTQHLGELAEGPLSNTKLGASCTVTANTTPQVLHAIEVNQERWNEHIG